MSLSNSPWRRWSADEIYHREQETEEEHLMFSFSPTSSQRFLTPTTINLSVINDEEVSQYFIYI